MDLVKSNGVKLETTSLSLTKRMDLDEGAQFVLALDTLESSYAWWIGGFLNAMEALHGEAYTQLIPEGKAHTWLVYKWVDSRVPHSIRRGPKTGLSYSHHQAIASLLHERQEIFLDKAEAEHLSVSALKKLIKAEKGKVEEPKLQLIVCPLCGGEFEVPA